MFIAHFGVAFGAKAAARKVSLGTLMLAAQFIDLLWPALLMPGLEQVRIHSDTSNGPPLDFVHYPISHSLLAVLGWAVLLAALHFGWRRDRRSAVVIALAVASHWLLDLIVHHPDLPLYPQAGPLVGLGLWSMPLAALLLELAIFAFGVRHYLRCTESADKAGTWGMWALIGLLALIHLANTFGSPPPNLDTLIWVGHAQWLLVAWGYWVDRHRRPRPVYFPTSNAAPVSKKLPPAM